jgi:hypothetical protein
MKINGLFRTHISQFDPGILYLKNKREAGKTVIWKIKNSTLKFS